MEVAPSTRHLTHPIHVTSLMPGNGNLQSWHPVPTIVPQSAEAMSILADSRSEAEAEYRKAENQNDPIGTTVWGRVNEQARKLALLYAISENHTNPIIGADAANWATTLMMHQTRRMLYMANAYSNENDFAMRCQRVIDLLSKWSEQFGETWMPYRDISRKLRWNRREHEDIRNALVDQERIETDSVVSGGRPKIV